MEQFYQLPQSEVIDLYKQGEMTFSLALKFYIKVKFAPGWKIVLDREKIMQEFDISIHQFRRAIARLKTEFNIFVKSVKFEDYKKGDYVLATKWIDGDPQDQWGVGFYRETFSNDITTRHTIDDSQERSLRSNGFRQIQRISPELGKWLLDNKSDIEIGGKSLWDIVSNFKK